MKASDTVIKGVQVIEFERAFDERGWFENVYDAEWLLKMGFEGTRPWKVCRAWNEREGTLRGLHYQLPPFDENKLVHCSQGSIMDVVVDLRKDSPTFGAYLTKTLAPEYHWGLWIPAGCAHGYQTLEPYTTVDYVLNNVYSPDHARGILWNDRELDIPWPLYPSCISERDTKFPLLKDAELP